MSNEEKAAENGQPQAAEDQAHTEETSTQAEATEVTQEDVPQDETPDPAQELAVWKDKYLRLHAEFDNFRKRSHREKADLISNAGAGVIKDMLPTLDDFDRAMTANTSNDDIVAVKQGFELIHGKLLGMLKTKGLQPMDSKGKTFDTEEHEAITQIPAPTDDLKGKVVDVVESGYTLNDRILRYAKVVVGQ